MHPGALDKWASSGSSTCAADATGAGGQDGLPFRFTAAEGLLSEQTSAVGMPCCEQSTPPPGPVLTTQRRERTESKGGGPDAGLREGGLLLFELLLATYSRHLNLLAQSKFLTVSACVETYNAGIKCEPEDCVLRPYNSCPVDRAWNQVVVLGIKTNLVRRRVVGSVSP